MRERSKEEEKEEKKKDLFHGKPPLRKESDGTGRTNLPGISIFIVDEKGNGAKG